MRGSYDFDWLVDDSSSGGPVPALRSAETSCTVAVPECGRRFAHRSSGASLVSDEPVAVRA